MDTVVALLTEDATWSMPPYAVWFSGLGPIAAFLEDAPLTQRWRHLPTTANGQPAVGCYRWDPERETFAAEVIDVLTLRDDGQIEAVTAFIDPALFPRFGLPARAGSVAPPIPFAFPARSTRAWNHERGHGYWRWRRSPR